MLLLFGTLAIAAINLCSVHALQAYQVTLPLLDIVTRRSDRLFETDTDYLAWGISIATAQGVAVDSVQTSTAFLGDLGTGSYPGFATKSFQTPPLADTDAIVLSYMIVNNGHSNVQVLLGNLTNDLLSLAAKQVVKTIVTPALEESLGELIGGVIGTDVVPLVGPALGVLAGWMVTQFGNFLFANCDGTVAAALHVLTANQLKQIVSNPLSGFGQGIMDDNTGSSSPVGCGNPSDYRVWWKVTPFGPPTAPTTVTPIVTYVAPSLAVLYGVPLTSYQSTFDIIVAGGYRPVWLDAFDVEGVPHFNAIFDNSTAANSIAWVARHELSSATFQTEFNTWTGQGFRLQWLDSYLSSGSVAYVALFVKDALAGQLAWLATWGLSADSFNAQFTNESSTFRLAALSVVATPTLQFSTLWDKQNSGAWTAWFGITESNFQAKFDSENAAGRRLKYLNAYNDATGTPNLIATFEATAPASYLALVGVVAADLPNTIAQWASQGFRLQVITAYEKAGAPCYGIIATH